MHESNRHTPCSAAIITPPGEGGIGVIRLAGSHALQLLGRLFHGKKNLLIDDPRHLSKLHYGHLIHKGETLDEVLVAVTESSPERQVVEINCHGGILAVERVMNAIAEEGATRVSAAQLPDLSLDAIQREAAMMLPRALSRQTVRMLLEQHDGELSRAIRRICELTPADAAAELRRLEQTARLGLALCKPARIVIAGSPNTGKSTLLNELTGSARAIVTDIPGTTRDFISEIAVISGLPVELIDTAGLRETDHLIEMEGIRGSRMQIEQADAVVFLLDASRPCTADERNLLAELRTLSLPLLVVANKIDAQPEGCDTQVDAELCISAKTGAGLQQLDERIGETIAGGAAYSSGPAVFTERQLHHIRSATVAAESGDCEFNHILLDTIF